MKRFFKRLLLAGCVLVGLVIFVFIVGALLPARHTFTRSMRLRQPPAAVFSVLADVGGLTNWSRNVQRVELLPAVDGHEATRQTFKGGLVMTIVTSESESPSRLVRTMVDGEGPFSGSWTYELKPADGGCRVVLTEQGEFRIPPFRVLARILGLTKYADEHLEDLAKKFGEPAVIQ